MIIRHRKSNEVIFDGANLRCANLSGANLTGANLRGAQGNGREVISFNCEFRGVVTSEFTWIGCRKHPTKTWWADSEKESEHFTDAHRLWRQKNGAWVRALLENVTGE